MFEQGLIDTLIVIGMFVVRVGVPIALVFFIGRWLQKKLSPEEEIRKTEGLPKGARIIAFRSPHNSIPTPSMTQDATEKRVSIK